MTRLARADEGGFLAGLVLCLALQGLLVGVPLWTQAALPGFDDAYAYINKTPQLETCVRQACPALVDLRRQIDTSSPDPEVARWSHRAHQRTLLVYHPLYSVLLLVLERLGMTAENAYRSLTSLGGLFLWLAIAYWLRTLWRPAPAGIALGLLALQVFPGQGLHQVVPSNLALGVLMLVSARLVARRGHATWALVGGTLALLTLHLPLGRLYAVALIALVAMLRGPRAAAWPMLMGGGLIAASLLVPLVMNRPTLTPEFIPLPATLGAWGRFAMATGADIARVIGAWVTPASAVPMVAAIALGYYVAPRGQADALFKTTLIVVALTAVSLALLAPGYPAEMFRRVWVLLAVLLTGAVAQAVCYLWGRLRAAVMPGRPHPWIQISLAPALAFVALVVLVASGGQTWRSALVQMQSYRSEFDAAQPARMAALARPGDRALYLHETPLLVYLSHGALAVGAVYYPILAGTRAEASWLARPELRFAVAWNPVMSLEVNGPSSIPVMPYRWIRLETPDAVTAEHIRMHLHSGRAPARVEARQLVPACDRTAMADLRPGRADWVVVTLPCGAGGRLFEIAFPIGGHAVRMSGLTVGDDSGQWPWARKARLTLGPRNPAAAVTMLSFDAATLLPEALGPVRTEVLADRGGTVLLRLER